MTSGIYVILNLVNGKVYVGSSKYVNGRLADHKILLARGIHGNAHLQSAWNKHGSAMFSFEVLRECPEDELLEQEQFHMDILDSMNPALGYNLKGAERVRELGDETRAKMSAARTGKTPSPEARAKMSAAGKGKPKSSEHRTALRVANQRYEHRAAISAAMKGNKHLLGHRHTLETRAKIGAGCRAAHRRPEVKMKVRLALKGRPWSDRRREAYLRSKGEQKWLR